MARMVLTLIGDDRSGLVDALSGVIAEHGGNWEESHLTELAGKFAGIVLVSVPNSKVDALVEDLAPLRRQGLLDVTAERALPEDQDVATTRLSLHLVGMDQPGIVHDVSHALAALDVSIETLETATSSAPMSAETLFTADAVLALPPTTTPEAVAEVLERLAHQLMVDIDVHPESQSSPSGPPADRGPGPDPRVDSWTFCSLPVCGSAGRSGTTWLVIW